MAGPILQTSKTLIFMLFGLNAVMPPYSHLHNHSCPSKTWILFIRYSKLTFVSNNTWNLKDQTNPTRQFENKSNMHVPSYLTGKSKQIQRPCPKLPMTSAYSKSVQLKSPKHNKCSPQSGALKGWLRRLEASKPNCIAPGPTLLSWTRSGHGSSPHRREGTRYQEKHCTSRDMERITILFIELPTE